MIWFQYNRGVAIINCIGVVWLIQGYDLDLLYCCGCLLEIIWIWNKNEENNWKIYVLVNLIRYLNISFLDATLRIIKNRNDRKMRGNYMCGLWSCGGFLCPGKRENLFNLSLLRKNPLSWNTLIYQLRKWIILTQIFPQSANIQYKIQK